MLPKLMQRCLMVALAPAATLVFACSDAPSAEQCEELLAHVVEIESEAAAGTASAGGDDDDTERRKSEILEYLGEEYVELCRDTYSRERVECALEASSYEQLISCHDG